MNILKIKQALKDAQESKVSALSDGSSDYHFWDGYEAAIKFALFHLDQGDQDSN